MKVFATRHKIHFVIANAILMLFELALAIQKLKWLPFQIAEIVFKIKKKCVHNNKMKFRA